MTAINPRPQSALSSPGLSWPRLAAAIPISALAALAVSEALYLAARTAGLLDRTVVLPSSIGMGPLSPQSVAVTALGAALGAGVLLAALVATTRRPLRNFRAAATLLALASLSMPATIPGPPVRMRLAMAAMHVAVWAVAVAFLPAAAGLRGGRS